MSSADTASFTSSFPYLDAFYFFFLPDLGGISHAVLTRGGENRHPCLVPDLGGKLQFVTIKGDNRCRFFLGSLY